MDDLDALLAEASRQRPEPSAALLARVLADARAAAEERQPATPNGAVAWGWRAWVDALGGWPTLGGLAASVAVGVWIGAVQPDLAAQAWGEGVSVAFGVDEDPLSLLEG